MHGFVVGYMWFVVGKGLAGASSYRVAWCEFCDRVAMVIMSLIMTGMPISMFSCVWPVTGLLIQRGIVAMMICCVWSLRTVHIHCILHVTSMAVRVLSVVLVTGKVVAVPRIVMHMNMIVHVAMNMHVLVLIIQMVTRMFLTFSCN